MGAVNFQDFTPIFPDVQELDPTMFEFRYDRQSDTFLLHFYGRAQPAISSELDDFTFLHIDPVSHRVVGIQIEGFLAVVVRRQPAMLELAELAGIDDAEIQRIRTEIDPELRRVAAVRSILAAHPDLVSA